MPRMPTTSGERQRIVFFGMDGSFSTIPLTALCRAGLPPVLVVHGVGKETWRRGEIVERHPAVPDRGWLARRRASPDAAVEHPLVPAAQALGIDSIRVSDAGAVRARAHILEAKADAFVIAGFPKLLPPSALKLARFGGLNVHPGALPAERGPAPLFWALKAGQDRIRITIHVVDAGEDSGDIVATASHDVEPGADAQAILAGCATSAVPHLIRSVRSLIAGDLVRTRQSRIGAGRCPRPKFRDGLLDPTQSARAVYTFVAACARWYSLFAECGGDRFFIEAAISYDDRASIGFEYALTGDRLVLQCRPGVVELRLRPEGALFSAEYVEVQPE